MHTRHLELAVLANLAYCAPGPDPRSIFAATGLPITHVFFLETAVDAQMYTLVLPDTVLFLCRGTDSMTDVGVDLMVRKRPCPSIPCAKVHRGFLRQYTSLAPTISEQVRKFASRVVFVGHSLGAALATIGAAVTKKECPDVRVECVTFGCPRVGNAAFAAFFNAAVDCHRRYVNGNDIITRVPRMNYTHVGNAHMIGDAAAGGCVARYIGTIRDHFMKDYIAGLEKTQA